ncbi:MAG: alginate export family protein [Nitrospirae bacterium]|nr:alginate export family protein [Nitrospirota bacterium]
MKRRWMFTLLTASLVAGMVGTSYADVKLSGAELRLRGIMVDNKDANQDGGGFEQRTRLGVDASVDNVKGYVQIQDSRMWGDENTTTDTAESYQALDVAQAYVDFANLGGAPLNLRIGRQALAYGDQRLIGSLEWNNSSRRFDAIKLTYKHSAADIDVFTAKIFDDGEDWGNDENLNGIYASLKNIPQVSALDLYLIQKIHGTDETNFYTLGARVAGAVSSINLDYGAELAFQSGDATNTVNQDANAFDIRAGYTIPNVLGGLRLGIEYAAATGQDSSSDSTAFDNLYPTNHYLYGFTDDVIWSNTNSWSINASMTPIDKLKLAIEYWNYKLAEDVGGKDDNGSEINIRANHELSKNVNCEAAYVIRDAGDVTTAAYGGYGTIPVDKSATFGYFMINVKFM